jgi:hypothetical protein
MPSAVFEEANGVRIKPRKGIRTIPLTKRKANPRVGTTNRAPKKIKNAAALLLGVKKF